MEQWKINAKYVRECAVSLSEFAQACRVFAMTAKHFNDIVIKIKHEQYSNERRAARHQGEMGSEEYAAFMQELAEWAQTQADMAEYADDIYQHYDND